PGVVPVLTGVHHGYVPWYAPRTAITLRRPFAARAIMVAHAQTSEPFFANIAHAAHGVSATRRSASSTNGRPYALKHSPSAASRRGASSTRGWLGPRTIGP